MSALDLLPEVIEALSGGWGEAGRGGGAEYCRRKAAVCCTAMNSQIPVTPMIDGEALSLAPHKCNTRLDL